MPTTHQQKGRYSRILIGTNQSAERQAPLGCVLAIAPASRSPQYGYQLHCVSLRSLLYMAMLYELRLNTN